jgi:hypothetical protein
MFLSAAFSAWEIAKSHTEPCRGSTEPDEPQGCCVWRRKSESDAQNGRVFFLILFDEHFVYQHYDLYVNETL